MNPLERVIIERIMKEGPITFETFMDMALYHPGMGYYSSKRIPIGRMGDFYTSPHLHSIFGVMIGRLLMEMWDVMGRPPVFHAVEMGAGAGYLCKDMLEYMEGMKDNGFQQALRYTIVEPNPSMEKVQRQTLGNIAGRVEWVRNVQELSRGIEGCIFSNELLDAFPVHIVEMDEEIGEVYVTTDGNKLFDIKHDVSTQDLINYIRQFSIQMSRGYRTEINLRIRDWLREMSSILHRGFLLTVDYGYSAEEYYNYERPEGTLLCYHEHRLNEDPYQHIGRQDITAHVNFSALKRWGDEFGLKTIGYCPQGVFLVASGIDEVITELYAHSPDYSFQVSRIKGLILPQGMGESHKVLVQYRGEGSPELRGFSLRNHVDKL